MTQDIARAFPGQTEVWMRTTRVYLNAYHLNNAAKVETSWFACFSVYCLSCVTVLCRLVLLKNLDTGPYLLVCFRPVSAVLDSH